MSSESKRTLIIALAAAGAVLTLALAVLGWTVVRAKSKRARCASRSVPAVIRSSLDVRS